MLVHDTNDGAYLSSRLSEVGSQVTWVYQDSDLSLGSRRQRNYLFLVFKLEQVQLSGTLTLGCLHDRITCLGIRKINEHTPNEI